MAFAMHWLGRYPEAVDAARTAVRLEPGNDKAHYLLGTLLVRDWRTLREGITQLERALASVPAAQVNLDLAKQVLAKSE
jgi:cytochrome c-type biogenesis protein CcmH/NrfG